MKMTTLIILRTNKIMTDEQGREISRSGRLRELLSTLDRNTVVSVNICNFYKVKEVIVPALENQNLDQVLTWKISRSFPEFVTGYLFAARAQKGTSASRLQIKFVKQSYVRLIEKQLKHAKVSVSGWSIDGDPVLNPPTEKKKKLNLYVLICVVLLLAALGNLYQWSVIKTDVQQTMMARPVLPVTEVQSSEPLPSLSALGFAAAAPTPTARTGGRTRRTLGECFSRLNEFMGSCLPEDTHIQSLAYFCQTGQIRFDCWASVAELPSVNVIEVIQEPGVQYYKLSGDYYVK